MSRVFWDTNLFIYLLEDYGPHSEGVAELLAKMEVRGDELLTSAITLGEVLVQPCSRGDVSRCQEYEEAIKATARILPFDAAASLNYARIRSQPRKIAPPDAIQLACAATAGVDLFLTNDVRLQGLHVEGIQFITAVDRAPF